MSPWINEGVGTYLVEIQGLSTQPQLSAHVGNSPPFGLNAAGGFHL